MPKISSKDQILQRTNQILDVPVPPMTEQLREVPKRVSQDRIQRRTAEQIVDRLVFKNFFQDRVQQRCVEQNIENPVPQMLSSWRKDPTWRLQTESSHGLPSRSSTCQFSRWWRNTLRQPRFPRGTRFNSVGGGVPVFGRHGCVSRVSEEVFSGCPPTGTQDTVAAGVGFTRKEVTGLKAPRRRVFSLCPNVVS